ncbi:1-acyl-sn-glycerol-3-phosphate acyltransferase [Anaerococcus prevotii]|uniref:1-acyl-sn-glycerol-3-phosphate acyltransferase n=1 Tax=Anaerococcus prevotii (strain ATCC 9321 / DSM 20548 / JCM 6508 / NCTC 11806 / PC1) TaxID=525919 RepID=C7RHT7_ANAPD|nr:lysophospholipid acyltransferase family protein [Anaerococcus prevotii]ACV29048.1 phospholipid/glycerol acyltransferase [Anaerococcus prevotii DSM 20548]SUU94721.1 1-acyl-sn-glycerol-3-phosphate acyltransferase [Anaerococcus prevotii]
MLYNFLVVLLKIICFPIFRIKVKGLENIEETDKVIVCANHKSLLDPIFLAISLPQRIYFMAKKELFDKPFVGGFLKALGAFPVDRFGRDLKALRASVALVNEGKILGIFPEGTRVKEVKRENVKDGVAFVALKAKADIMPVEIISTYKPFRKSEILIKKPIAVSEFASLKNKEAMKKMTDRVYDKIYEHHTIVESENQWK